MRSSIVALFTFAVAAVAIPDSSREKVSPPLLALSWPCI
ncbi:hypothetical protein AA0113_g5800 [Alternaria arborescens]|uniref:Uncharacterized protein n=2 Tax=Alternaria sect. Alternaria TaxID=2499237 RepID=A0A4Q4S4E8_9PLEO|nr:hypothetical protein AA0119_g3149 [Alternaria tenuissima]RYO20911.1 hypothetical protein AA0121_g3489 [Alternaria tenuissima]RYO64751.1 hypothetical protein AA0113_g5800 [Alternaria arborescens]